MGSLLFDIILQVIDSLYLFISCGSIDGGLLAEFSEPEYFIGNLVIGFFALGFLDKLLLEGYQLLVDVFNGGYLRSSDDRGNVELQLCLIATFVSKHLVDCLDDSILKNQLVNSSRMAFHSSGFKFADAAPDDRFNSSIVPVDPSEHFIAFTADDDL